MIDYSETPALHAHPRVQRLGARAIQNLDRLVLAGGATMVKRGGGCC